MNDKKLTRDDFKDEGGYLSFKQGDLEICIEPCLNGADVAVYRNQDLLEDKRCTDEQVTPVKDPFAMLEVLKKIEQWSNEYYQKYFKSV